MGETQKSKRSRVAGRRDGSQWGDTLRTVSHLNIARHTLYDLVERKKVTVRKYSDACWRFHLPTLAVQLSEFDTGPDVGRKLIQLHEFAALSGRKITIAQGLKGWRAEVVGMPEVVGLGETPNGALIALADHLHGVLKVA